MVHVCHILITRVLMYSVFTINVPLAVRFATVAIGMRKAESPEYGRLTGTCISECIHPPLG